MLNSRMKRVLVLLAIFLITLACSKKEETKTEGVKQETPAEQKSAMTGQSQEQPATETARQEEEQKTAPAESSAGTSEQAGSETTAAGGQGKEVYQRTCSSCHETGVAGAPKAGDRQAWSSRLEKGEDQLVQNAINGIGAMPPKGGDPSLGEEEIRAAVNYMIEQSR
jgi:cytochrome c5